MDLLLRPADSADRDFCESLNRLNMGGYLAARGIPWDSRRFLASWADFENLMILEGSHRVGHLRLMAEPDALGLRDLQVLPGHQARGIGSWAVRQAQSMAASRGYRRLQLRVYEDNAARSLYARLGFTTFAARDGTVHMAWWVPSGRSSDYDPNSRQRGA